MGNIVDAKAYGIAEDFVKSSKKAFAEKIARNTVKDIDVSEGKQDEAYTAAARFVLTGSVETSSPTGKPRTYGYHATVDVVGKKASLVELKVDPLDID